MSSLPCLPWWSTSQQRKPQSQSLTTYTARPPPQLHPPTRMSRNLVISVVNLGTLLLTVWRTEKNCAEHSGNLATCLGNRTIYPMSARLQVVTASQQSLGCGGTSTRSCSISVPFYFQCPGISPLSINNLLFVASTIASFTFNKCKGWCNFYLH